MGSLILGHTVMIFGFHLNVPVIYLDLSDTLEAHHQLRFLLSCTAVFTSLLFMKNKNPKPLLLNFAIVSMIVCQKYLSLVSVAQAVYCLVALKFCIERSRDTLFESIILICFLLHNEANVICIFLQVCILKLLSFSKISCDNETRAVIFCIVAKCSFFYLGNSNALSTIDVGAGYMGLTQYYAGAVIVLMAVHTYAGPLITFAYALQTIRRDLLLKVYFTQIWLDLLVFCVLCIGLRYHIFVWTVFSPKLLYFGMELIVMISFLIIYHLYFLFIY